ncbi:zf-HC2 domain-containing protein [Nocardia sp. NPDC024068]|uniref:zf-HC2 domain-containing protein n=1 Tax=Nocardia sp. NPDC024068 TaxID=3157197 RepID=UPI0033DD6D01
MDCDEAAELVTAFLDGALDEPSEVRFIEHLAACAACETYLEQIRGTVSVIGGLADEPPTGLSTTTRDHLLGAFRESAAHRWTGIVAAAARYCPYAAQVLMLDAVLRDLPDADWLRPVTARGNPGEPVRSIRETVACLAAADNVLARYLGEPDTAHAPDEPTTLTPLPTLPVSRVRTRWFAQAARICAALGSTPPSTMIPLRAGLPLPDAVRARALETWIRTTDIAETAEVPVPVPKPETLTSIADLGVRMLPAAFRAGRREPAGGTAEITLSGPGGGRWTVPLASGDRRGPVTSIDMDIVDFCLLAGGRRDPATVTYRADGDHALASDLLAAAPAVTGPGA